MNANAAICRIDSTSRSRPHHSLTTAHNPPPPNSTRLCTRRKTTHNMKDSPPRGRHDNFTHRTDATQNATNTQTQTPSASTSHNQRAKHNHPPRRRPPTRLSAAQPNTAAHAPRNHTPKQSPLNASTHARTARPESPLVHS